MKNTEFYKLLHSRFDEKSGARMNTTLLAERAGVGRCHLIQVLNNVPGRGKHTRRRLFPLLTLEEIKTLGWEHGYELWTRHYPDRQCHYSTEKNVPNETIKESEAPNEVLKTSSTSEQHQHLKSNQVEESPTSTGQAANLTLAQMAGFAPE
jgi:hypothetical protein